MYFNEWILVLLALVFALMGYGFGYADGYKAGEDKESK